MDYEKMYKAVLKTATQWIKDGCSDKEKICLENVFPELRESENERITRAINNMLPFIHDEAYTNNGVTRDDVLTWLEKQKKQPIFKIGDTLKKKGKDYTFTVDRIRGGYYLTANDSFFPIEEQNKWELVKEQKH